MQKGGQIEPKSLPNNVTELNRWMHGHLMEFATKIENLQFNGPHAEADRKDTLREILARILILKAGTEALSTLLVQKKMNGHENELVSVSIERCSNLLHSLTESERLAKAALEGINVEGNIARLFICLFAINKHYKELMV